MPKNKFSRYDHQCCQLCKARLPAACSPEYQMSVKMTKKCLGYVPARGLIMIHYDRLYKLEAEDAKR